MASDTEHLAYDQLCKSYQGIDDFRAKLLGFLPLATGAGILFTIKESPSLLQSFSPPIAVFGFLITFGLFCYEIYGITKCSELIRTGKKLELALEVQGQFVSRPHGVFGLVNEPFAAGIIYPAVAASWIFVAFVRKGTSQDFQYWCQRPWIAWVISGFVFVTGFVFTLMYDRHLAKAHRDGCDACGRPFEDGDSARTRISTIKTSPDYWLCSRCSESLLPWLESRRST